MKLRLLLLFVMTLFLGALFSTYAQKKTKVTTTRSTKTITTQKATTEDGRDVVLKSNGTWQYAQDLTINSIINFQGEYQANTSFSTANNTYQGTDKLTLKKITKDSYAWTREERGYQTFYDTFGTCRATNNVAECYFSGIKDREYYPGIDEIKKDIPYFTLKIEGKSLLTKWGQLDEEETQYKGFIRYFKKIR